MAQLSINEKAKDFSLADYNGDVFKLSDLKDTRNILIVLNRGFV